MKYVSRSRRTPKDPGYGWDVKSFDSGDVFMISNGKYDRPKRARRNYDDDFTEVSERRTKKKERYSLQLFLLF